MSLCSLMTSLLVQSAASCTATSLRCYTGTPITPWHWLTFEGWWWWCVWSLIWGCWPPTAPSCSLITDPTSISHADPFQSSSVIASFCPQWIRKGTLLQILGRNSRVSITWFLKLTISLLAAQNLRQWSLQQLAGKRGGVNSRHSLVWSCQNCKVWQKMKSSNHCRRDEKTYKPPAEQQQVLLNQLLKSRKHKPNMCSIPLLCHWSSIWVI